MSTILLINSVLPWVRGVLPPRQTVVFAEFPLMRTSALFPHKSEALYVKLEVDTQSNNSLVFLCLPSCTLCHPTTSSKWRINQKNPEEASGKKLG